MFDNFDLYESCEEYYENRHVIDSYQYFLSHENDMCGVPDGEFEAFTYALETDL